MSIQDSLDIVISEIRRLSYRIGNFDSVNLMNLDFNIQRGRQERTVNHVTTRPIHDGRIDKNARDSRSHF